MDKPEPLKPAGAKARPDRKRRSQPRAAAAVHEHIGRALRNMFEEVVAQPIPNKFVLLLKELEKKQSGR
ncbi:MAG TPA: NepR family anti-sigma factor [Hyphomicrobiaceae bacterium]|jgi:hypothetical protein|nr:NepR family anti-sigma factor [Hyphomicrobiaceae bacterium]